ncbi:hypothetical protein ARMGADRAFT_1033959 [Armillaria gallica]|uniref:Uncharacterized protein n=1 Tax=Armillaria gallica TaxID=47427 RepID=A0A2H3DK36_ARMGA|nr:hypothetical protein ARMGADRAFT_1033959 [Armillaria gallica]
MISISCKGTWIFPAHCCTLDSIRGDVKLIMTDFMDPILKTLCSGPLFQPPVYPTNLLDTELMQITHLDTDGRYRKDMGDCIVPVLNSNPRITTVNLQRVHLTFGAVDVRAENFTRLALWNCTFSILGLDDILNVALSLQFLHIGGGYTTLAECDDCRKVVPHFGGELQFLKVNFTTIRYKGETRVKSDACRRVIKYLFWLRHLPKLEDLQLKLYTTDAKIVSHIATQSGKTLMNLTLDYQDTRRGNLLIDFGGAEVLKEVIKLAVVQDIKVHVLAYKHTDKLNPLGALDMHAYRGQFPKLDHVAVIIIQTLTLTEDNEDDVPGYERLFELRTKRLLAHLYTQKKATFTWLHEGLQGLDDEIQLQVNMTKLAVNGTNTTHEVRITQLRSDNGGKHLVT